MWLYAAWKPEPTQFACQCFCQLFIDWHSNAFISVYTATYREESPEKQEGQKHVKIDNMKYVERDSKKLNAC